MAEKYVLDACALLAFIYKETGVDVVKSIFEYANNGDAEIFVNKINLFEVFYNVRRADGLLAAEAVYDKMMGLPIKIINALSDEVFFEASRLKTSYKMSVADCIALAEASVLGASLITSDHHEFDAVEQNESINFTWIR